MSQATTEYLFDAIDAVLQVASGEPRALTASQVFGAGLPPAVDRELRSIRCREATNKKTAFVAIEDIVASQTIADELGSDHLYELTLTISRDYHLGYELSGDEVRATMIRVADDFMRIRKTICFPSAFDSLLNDPGIAEGGIRGSGARSVIRVEQIGDGKDRLVNAIDRFETAFLFTPGS